MDEEDKQDRVARSAEKAVVTGTSLMGILAIVIGVPILWVATYLIVGLFVDSMAAAVAVASIIAVVVGALFVWLLVATIRLGR